MSAYGISLDIRALRMASEKIGKEMADLATSIIAAKVPDYASYCEKRGNYYGLHTALEILKEVEKSMK